MAIQRLNHLRTLRGGIRTKTMHAEAFIRKHEMEKDACILLKGTLALQKHESSKNAVIAVSMKDVVIKLIKAASFVSFP